jgi:hypothetical protein
LKSFPFLPSQPFEAVYAIGTIKAPTQSSYIQYNNDNEQANDKFHYAPYLSEIHSSRGGAGGEAPLTGTGVPPETFSFLLLASVGGSYEWMSGLFL